MSVIVAVVPSPLRLQRLRAALREGQALVPCDSMEAATEICVEQPVHVAVLDLEAAGAPTFDRVRELRRRAPRVALIAYVALTPERLRHVFDAGRYGFDELVVVDVDDTPSRFARAIEKAGARGVAGLLRAALSDVRDAAVRDALMLVVTRAHEGLTPLSTARIVGLSRRALARALLAAGFPPPGQLVTWGRLIVAAGLMDDTHHSADRIALTLGFPSGSAFRNTCQRYLGTTPTGIRERGGAAWVVDRFATLRHADSSGNPVHPIPPNVPGLQDGGPP